MKIIQTMLILAVSAAVCRADYVDEVLADSPEAYYRFEEPPGSTQVLDSSGNGHHSTAVSNVTFNTAGVVGLSGHFNADGHIQLDFNRSPADGNFSVECLVRFAAPSPPRALVSQQDASGTGRLILSRGDDGKIQSWLGGVKTAAEKMMAVDEWHHLVLTSDIETNTVKIYIDGVKAAGNSVTQEAANGVWILGAGKDLDDEHKGLLDEVAVYPFCLSEKRIWEHFIKLRGLQFKHYVSVNGASVAPYASWETAATNVQTAVDAAQPDSIIRIGDGIFYESSPFQITNAVTLQSVNGPDATFIRPPNPENGFTVNLSGGCTVRGLSIGGIAADGTGPLVNGSMSLYQMRAECCIFQCVGSPAGTALNVSGSTLRNCIVRNMECFYSANIFECTVDYSLFSSIWMTNSFSAGGIRSYSSLYRNCAFVDVVSPGESPEDRKSIVALEHEVFSNCTFNMEFPVGGDDGGSASCVNCYSNDADGMVDAGIVIFPFDRDIRGVPRFLDGNGDTTSAPDIGPYEVARSDLDSDGDGTPDDMEVEMGLNPLVDEFEQTESWLANGISRGEAEVVSNHQFYGLYTTNAIADLEMGRMTLQPSNGNSRLSFRMRQQVGGIWTNAGDAIQWQFPVPAGAAFYRVRGSE